MSINSSSLHWLVLTFAVITANSTYAKESKPFIKHVEKIGIGTGAWGKITPEQASADVARIGAQWYYTWLPKAPTENTEALPKDNTALFIPMVWSDYFATASSLADLPKESTTLLGFNEPDNESQANMSVELALELWPQLEKLNKRLGSPSNSSNSHEPARLFLDPKSWLRRFMKGAEERELRIDFMALHYYTVDPDVTKMRAHLIEAHKLYKRPIWVTEWALVDWEDNNRFTKEETAKFLHNATHMMDDLDFVERHSWFAMYPGGDGWYINTEFIDKDGKLTVVGRTFMDLVSNGRNDKQAVTISPTPTRGNR